MQRLPRSCCRSTGSQTASTAACNFSWGQEGCVLKFPIVPAPSVPGPLQAITRPDRYWQQACGTTCKLEINPFDSLLCGQAAPSSCAEEKAPSQPWGRRRNCPVWAFRQRFTLCGHMRRGDMGTPQLSLLTTYTSHSFLKISSCRASKTQATSSPVLLGFTPAFF